MLKRIIYHKGKFTLKEGSNKKDVTSDFVGKVFLPAAYLREYWASSPDRSTHYTSILGVPKKSLVRDEPETRFNEKMYLLKIKDARDTFSLDGSRILPSLTQPFFLQENYKSIFVVQVDETKENILLEIFDKKLPKEIQETNLPFSFIDGKVEYKNLTHWDWKFMFQIRSETYSDINKRNEYTSHTICPRLANYLDGPSSFRFVKKIYNHALQLEVLTLDDLELPFLLWQPHSFSHPPSVCLLYFIVKFYTTESESILITEESLDLHLDFILQHLNEPREQKKEIISFIKKYLNKSKQKMSNTKPLTALQKKFTGLNKGLIDFSYLLQRIESFLKRKQKKVYINKKVCNKGPIEKKGGAYWAKQKLLQNTSLFKNKTPIISFENTIQSPFRADEFYDICRKDTIQEFETWLSQEPTSKKKREVYRNYLAYVRDGDKIIYDYRLKDKKYTFILKR